MKQPNILLLFPDQWRYDWLEDNDKLPLRTPFLSEMAKKGIKFTKAYTPSPLCAPARACLASGHDFSKCPAPTNFDNYPLDVPTFYQRLRDANYTVCGTGKFDLHKDTSDLSKLDWGLKGERLLDEWGFSCGIDNEGKMDGRASYAIANKPKGPYMKYLVECDMAEPYKNEGDTHAYITCLNDEQYCDNWITRNTIDFIENFPKDKPWFMQVNFAGPHCPMDVTPNMAKLYENVEFPMPFAEYDESEDHQLIRQYYAAEIENLDLQMRKIIEAIEKRGELDNTIVVFTSDHGDMLGDHNYFGKEKPEEGATHVPMIITGPNITPRVSDELISTHDLAATFIEYGEAKELENVDAKSMVNVINNDTTHRDYIQSGCRNWRMIYDGKYKLIAKKNNEACSYRLYDIENDVEEVNNLADKLAEVVKDLSTKLPKF